MSKAAKRESDDTRLDRMEREIGEIRGRVFNGLSSEIRKDVEKAVGGLRNLVVGILITLFLTLAGNLIVDRLSNSASTQENMRNYKAIVDLQLQVEKIQDCIGQ